MKLFGRATRHKDVRQCAVGGTFFYLFYRFETLGEFDEGVCPDFTDNKSWFDIKLLVSDRSADTTKVMYSESYANAMGKVLKELGVPSAHKAHIGRKLGPVELEFLEAVKDDIDSLGNWSPDTQRKFYSAKLPLHVLKLIAGFYSGMNFNIRTVVFPCEELKGMIMPWADVQLKRVQESPDGDGKWTACCFLSMVIKMKDIVLQDAAAMMVLHPERCHHHLFTLPVFQTELFQVSWLVVVFLHQLLCLSPFLFCPAICREDEAGTWDGIEPLGLFIGAASAGCKRAIEQHDERDPANPTGGCRLNGTFDGVT